MPVLLICSIFNPFHMPSLHQIQSALSASLPTLRQKYPISRLALFGSVTRDDYDPEKSDIDIMVEFDGEIGWEFFDLQDELRNLLNREVHLATRQAIKPHYWQYIKEEIIYVA